MNRTFRIWNAFVDIVVGICVCFTGSAVGIIAGLFSIGYGLYIGFSKGSYRYSPTLSIAIPVVLVIVVIYKLSH